MATTPPRARRLPSWAFAVLAIVATIVGRGMFEGRASIRRSDELAAHGDIEGAVAHAMRATKWYIPLASHPREGYDRLRTIAFRAELAGDIDTALIAWQAIRSGARGTRSLWTPYSDRLTEADDHIAALLASKPPPAADKDKPREQLMQEHRTLLARDDTPRAFAVIVFYLGLAVWLFGAWHLAHAVDAWSDDPSAGDRWAGGRGRAALTGGALALVGIVTFLLALARA